MNTINEMIEAVHDNAVKHGWWEHERPISELLCLIHSEVSEALEAYRNKDKENFNEELADIVIRVFDMAGGYNIDLQNEIIKKHRININRSYKHGGKLC